MGDLTADEFQTASAIADGLLFVVRVRDASLREMATIILASKRPAEVRLLS